MRNYKTLILIINLFNNIFSNNFDGIYTTDQVISNGDTIQNCTFIVENENNIDISLSGSINANYNFSTLYFKTQKSTDIINVNIFSDAFICGFDANNPIVVSISGPGKVYFNIYGGAIFNIGCKDYEKPAYFMIQSDNPTELYPNYSTNCCIRAMDSINGINSIFKINKGSIVGFMSAANKVEGKVPVGNLYFNASRLNKYEGLNTDFLVLSIEDNSGLAIETIECDNLDENNYTNIHFDQVWINQNDVCGSANFYVINNIDNTGLFSDLVDYNSVYSNLLIENKNTVEVFNRYSLLEKPSIEVLQKPRSGFVLGRGGNLKIEDGSSIIYDSRTYNYVPNPINFLNGGSSLYLSCKRNASAFYCEGLSSLIGNRPNFSFLEKDDIYSYLEQYDYSAPKILFGNGKAALYMMSSIPDGYYPNNILNVNYGISVNGIDQIVPSYLQGPGCGTLSFIVNGQTFILGKGSENSIFCPSLDFEHFFYGGSLLPDSNETIFPKRTFDSDLRNVYKQYGKSFIEINDKLVISGIGIRIDGSLHNILPYGKNNYSEPIIVGGDSFAQLQYQRNKFVSPEGFFISSTLDEIYQRRPKIYMHYSDIYICNEKGFALSGLDLEVDDIKSFLPNGINIYQLDGSSVNLNKIKFYYSGLYYPQYLILGTSINNAALYNSYLPKDSSIDILRNTNNITDPFNLGLELKITYNKNNLIDNQVCKDESFCNHPLSVINLNEGSTISVGKAYQNGILNYPKSTLSSDSKFISFIGTGNITGDSGDSFVNGSNSIVLRQGSNLNIYFDEESELFKKNKFIGFFKIPVILEKILNSENNPNLNVSKNNVFFSNSTGMSILDDFSCCPQVADFLVIDSGYYLNSFILDCTNKIYSPFVSTISKLSNDSAFGTINASYLDELEIFCIKGILDELIINNSAICNGLIRVKGGIINNFVVRQDSYPNFSKTGVTVILETDENENPGIIKFSKDKNEQATINEFSQNGAVICLKNKGKIFLEKDMEVRGSAQFFTIDGSDEYCLEISSNSNNKIIVKSGSVLDFTHMGLNSVIKFTGNLKLIFEPKSAIALNNGLVLKFENESSINFTNEVSLVGSSLNSNLNDNLNNSIFVLGNGSFNFYGKSELKIEKDAVMWIRNNDYLNDSLISINDNSDFKNSILVSKNDTSSIKINLNDASKFLIGNNEIGGGILQIGDPFNDDLKSLEFYLNLNGKNSIFQLSKSGFIGFGAARVGNDAVCQLYNLKKCNFFVNDGTLILNRIDKLDNIDSSLVAFGYYDKNIFNIKLSSIINLTESGSSSQSYLNDNYDYSRFLGGSNVLALTINGSLLNYVKPIDNGIQGISLNGEYMFGIISSLKEHTFNKRPINIYNINSDRVFEYLTPTPIKNSLNIVPATLSNNFDNIPYVVYVKKDENFNDVIKRVPLINIKNINSLNKAIKNGFILLKINSENENITPIY